MSEKVLGHLKKGLVFVLSAPSGTGKTTLVRMLTQESPHIVESVSSTTRAPRRGEVEGKDYFFITQQEFAQKIKEGEFLEHATVFGNSYGTLKESVLLEQEKGKHVILVIDTQGVLSLKEQNFEATYIFLSPPSTRELEQRLHRRETETQEVMQQRLDWAKEEMNRISYYDYHIVNDRLDNAYIILKSIIIAEEYRRR